MFELLKYDIDLKRDGTTYLRIDLIHSFKNTKKFQVKLINPTFTEIYHVIAGDIEVPPNVGWCVQTTIKKPFDLKFNNDCQIHFIDSNTKEIIQCISIPSFTVDYKRRSLGQNFNKKNIWIFGDSHIDCFFSYNVDNPILQTSQYTLNPISNAALTINRFTNRDYLKFLSSLPIIKGDEIIFMLGEIDCRISLLRNALLKNLPIENHTQNVISKYKSSLDHIQTKYPECKIKVCTPLPPLPEGWVEVDKDILLGNFTQEDRINTRNLVIKELQSQIGDTYSIIDITPNLMDDKNLSNTLLLKEDDIHFIPSSTVINNIKNHLNG
jgi:hypothetical protein